jgi:hypothetical protein
MSKGVGDRWRDGVSKALERQMSAYTPEKMAKRA